MSFVTGSQAPCVLATWKFGGSSVELGSKLLNDGASAVEAAVESIKLLELENKEQYFVGIGGYPNADGKMEFDGAIMDHRSNYGAVLGLQEVTTPIAVARTVMEKCVHNVLVGEGSLQWAVSNGFEREPEVVLTSEMKDEWEKWREEQAQKEDDTEKKGHDTVGVICLDRDGRLACGTSTSGWRYKHPGRVGDAPLIGSGLYCDGNVGAAVCSGDGEEIMRGCLAFLVVENMRNGLSPGEACRVGIRRIMDLHPKNEVEGPTMYERGSLTVAVIAMDKNGRCGAASTLSSDNQHRGKAGFPAAVYSAARTMDVGSHQIFEAGISGKDF
jgi:N4-(beta-N-acetylglucosaminyl)-L-asparaginase